MEKKQELISAPMLNGDVEQIISRITQQTNTPVQVYKIPFRDLSHAEKSLMEAYRFIVSRRGNNMVVTTDLEERISMGAEWMVKHPDKWLYLHGFVGTGKTSFMKAIILLLDSMKFTVRNTEIVSVKRVLSRDIDNMDDESINELKNTPILAIDDLGEERWQSVQYGNIREISTEIIETRYDRRKLTFFTSNYPFRKIEEKYGMRVYDRMLEMAFIIPFTNKSYRHE